MYNFANQLGTVLSAKIYTISYSLFLSKTDNWNNKFELIDDASKVEALTYVYDLSLLSLRVVLLLLAPMSGILK